jgi:hypothetical protein
MQRSFNLDEKTMEILNFARSKMIAENALLGDSRIISWDVVFSKLANHYVGTTNQKVERRATFLKEESSKVDILRNEMKEYFKQNNSEILQEIKSIKTQNDMALTRVESIQNFNASLNEDMREFSAAIKSLMADIKETYTAVVQKLESKVKRHFGIAIPILLHHIIKNDSLLLKKLDTDEAVKEVNKIVSEYKNYYNSSSQYSNDEIEKIIDKYAMTKHLKKE